MGIGEVDAQNRAHAAPGECKRVARRRGGASSRPAVPGLFRRRRHPHLRRRRPARARCGGCSCGGRGGSRHPRRGDAPDDAPLAGHLACARSPRRGDGSDQLQLHAARACLDARRFRGESPRDPSRLRGGARIDRGRRTARARQRRGGGRRHRLPASSRTNDGRPPPRPGRGGRARRADEHSVHLGHHRAAQGCDADPSVLAHVRTQRRRAVPGSTRTDPDFATLLLRRRAVAHARHALPGRDRVRRAPDELEPLSRLAAHLAHQLLQLSRGGRKATGISRRPDGSPRRALVLQPSQGKLRDVRAPLRRSGAPGLFDDGAGVCDLRSDGGARDDR